jgi:hypothetical protein
METWSEIRRDVLNGGLSKRAAIAKYEVGWHTLQKMLAHDEPPGHRQFADPIPLDRSHRLGHVIHLALDAG